MNTKFVARASGVLLWVGCLSAYAQRAAAPSQRMLQCSGQATRLPGSIAGPCKTALADTQTQRFSNDLPRQDDNAVYVEFVVPGSTCEASFPRCTTPVAINPSGAVTGFYADTNASLHGFVRSPLGTITAFDGPDATCSGYFTVCTRPVGINLQGAITGGYCDAVGCHGFLRASGGTFTQLDAPGGANGTYPTSINDAGEVVGYYYDANYLGHGFLRTARGTFTSFNAPGGVNGTYPTGINDAGEVVGSYYNEDVVPVGFLRATDGTITKVDPAGSIYTSPNAINLGGAITGWWQDGSSAIHGFLRSTDGTFTNFDVPGSNGETEPGAIDPAGTITGIFQSTAGGQHGFVRANDGTFTTFDPPGSAEPSAYTFANGINGAGVITGWYIDPSFIGHGFLRIPIL
jgi:predicted membrane protein